MTFNLHDVVLMLPEAFLLLAACAILLIDLFLKPSQRDVTHWLSLAALLATMALIAFDDTPNATAFNGMYLHDGVSAVLRIFILATTEPHLLPATITSGWAGRRILRALCAGSPGAAWGWC